jgi:hypothetical protein
MRKSLIFLFVVTLFLIPISVFAFGDINEYGGDAVAGASSNAAALANSTAIAGSNSVSGAVAVAPTIVAPIQQVITQREFTGVAVVQGELPRPFQGRVEVIGEDKIGETWSQKGEGLDFKPDYVKVIFWSTKSQVVKQLDKDRFSIWPAHIQYADAQGSIATKYGKLYQKYGDKVVVKVELHDGWTGYGVSPSTAASANPSGNTGAMAGGFLSFAGGQSMAYVAIVYYLIK